MYMYIVRCHQSSPPSLSLPPSLQDLDSDVVADIIKSTPLPQFKASSKVAPCCCCHGYCRSCDIVCLYRKSSLMRVLRSLWRRS